MSLTQRERKILQLANQGLSDYKIARILNASPPTISKSHKSARKKFANAIADVEWATKTGLDFVQDDFNLEESEYS